MRRYLTILLALVAVLAAVGALAAFRSPVLGLDLQGGLSVVLEATPPKGGAITPEGMDRAVEIIRNRVDRLGVGEPDIRKQGQNQIVVELAGVFDPARAAAIIGKTAQLEFYDLQGDLAAPSIGASGQIQARTTLPGLLSGQQKAAKKGTPEAWFLVGKDKKVIAGPGDTKEQLLAQVEGGEQPAGSEFLAVPEGRIVITCSTESAAACPGVGAAQPGLTYYYLFTYQPDSKDKPVPEMTGTDLKLDGTRSDFQNNEPVVLMQFTDEGGDKFHQITRELAQRGQLAWNAAGRPPDATPYFQQFAIVLDDEIRSYPYINFRENPDGISGGSAQISGLQSVQEAKDLALVLQTGALPYTFNQVERTDVSATLGADSLNEALIAGAVGLALVALFLLLFYRFLGLVAVIGLAIYGVFLYGALLLFNVTLTLPGFAGVILTIGVAADANVVIFERIKEEVHAGRSVRAAIATGYRKGFHTIVDANVVTMITAFVLFAVATAGVKGFALMLLIGTLISMLTAVAATRALLGVLAGFSWFDNPAFMGASALRVPRWQRFDFVGRRRFWFAASATIVAVSIVSLAVKGLNLGIDFRGGSQISFTTPAARDIAQVRDDVAAVVSQNAVVQGRGPSVGGSRYSQFQVRTESLSTPEQNELRQALASELGAQSVGIKNVSASFSSQILRGAIIAVIVSLLLIIGYVSIRFEWRFAVPVLASLAHDIVIAVGVYSLSGREVSAATIAAILTILGYSLYDTIIIFDRVRENIPLMRRSSFQAIANQSVWETIRRSLATTFITLLPVGALMVFGGETLRDFAFALLVGISLGAYSTIFIAVPLLATLKEREPEFARRRDAGLREKLDHLEPAEDAAEAAPEPVEVPVAASPSGDGGAAAAAARREARRKRRRARPHGRAR